MINLLKLNIARARWGALSRVDVELVKDASFGKLMGACYIRSSRLSSWSCNTLE